MGSNDIFPPCSTTDCSENLYINNCTDNFEYTCTNFWNNGFCSNEPHSDFAVLHSELQEIKTLVCEIKDFIRDFFAEETKG